VYAIVRGAFRVLSQLSDRGWIPLRKTPLMPIGIDRRFVTGGIQLGDLCRREAPVHGSQILAQLVRIACADDHRGNGRPMEQPVDRDLRHSFAGLFRHIVDGVHNPMNVFIGQGRTCVDDGLTVKATDFRKRLPAAYLPGQTAPAERTPDDRADLLVQRQRHRSMARES
jgi:hypothetical protein